MAIRLRPNRVRVTVNSAAIAAQSLPGGMIWDNMARMRNTNVALARAASPKRTTELMRSIGGVLTPNGRNHCRYTVYADAAHAKFVLGGTTGPIHAKGYIARPGVGPSKNMLVRPAPSSYYTRPTLRRVVSGQEANNFLQRSMRATLRVHRVG